MKKIKSEDDFNDFNGSDRTSPLNLTGSPLRDDCSIDGLLSHSIAGKVAVSKPWEDVEEKYTPIDIRIAREIFINIANQNFPDSRGWIFILCSSEQAPLHNSTFLLSLFLLPLNQNIRGIANYLGVFKQSEKTMEDLLQRHFSFIGKSTKLSTSIQSIFQITPNVNLKFANTTSALNPNINHIDESSEVSLYQQVKIGKSHVLCEDFWTQINLLNSIKLEILSFKNKSTDGGMSEPNYDYGFADMTFENLHEKVNRILSEVNIITEQTDATVDTSLEVVIKRARHRQLSEISDLLWDLLKYTSSYSDLKKIIKFVFQIASRSNVVNLPTSNNKLSELIRELSQQRLAIPHLIGTEPLELLLEIGIEKLLKDFEFILNESKICQLSHMSFGSGKSQPTGDNRLSVRKSLAAAAVDLNHSTRKTLLKGSGGSCESNEDEEEGMRNSRFVERDVEMNISKLAQIHLAIEHLLLVQNNITIDNDYAAITKKLFAKPRIAFEDLQTLKYDKFEISINDKKVIKLVDNLVPNAQKVVIESGNKFKRVKSIFCFNIDQTVPSLEQKESNEGEVVDKSGDTFHFIAYTTIASNF